MKDVKILYKPVVKRPFKLTKEKETQILDFYKTKKNNGIDDICLFFDLQNHRNRIKSLINSYLYDRRKLSIKQ